VGAAGDYKELQNGDEESHSKFL